MEIFNRLISIIYPNKCIFCKQILYDEIIENDFVCKNCGRVLPTIPSDIREICIRNEETGKHITGYSFDKCISYFYYQDIIKRVITDFKFNGKRSYARPLATYMSEMIQELSNEIHLDIITYVPMHKLSKRKRGYDQAQLLATELSKLINIPVRDDILFKKSRNKNQHTLKLSFRSENVKGVYSIGSKDFILGKNILLVDDIVTSGYTISECSKIMKENGAGKIYCVSLAATDSRNL